MFFIEIFLFLIDGELLVNGGWLEYFFNLFNVGLFEGIRIRYMSFLLLFFGWLSFVFVRFRDLLCLLFVVN